MSHKMIADHDVLIDRIMVTWTGPNTRSKPKAIPVTTLTRSEDRILRYYKKIGTRAKGGLYFCRSLEQIARATDCTEKTVRRANEHFEALNILVWIRGHEHCANRYHLIPRGIQ
jgi:hypothetical protein